MSKHTPGPWDVIEVNEVMAILPDWPDGEQPDVNDKYDIAHCYGPDQVANARLIAAAPCLLDALQAINAYWESGNFTSQERLWEPMRAAIAKATGEAP